MKRRNISYICGARLQVPDVSVYDYLLKRLRWNASSILSRCHEDELSLTRLKEESGIYARAFKSLGISPGEIVPICLPPCNEAIILFFALNRIGAISTFVSNSTSCTELKDYIEKFQSKVSVISPRQMVGVDELIDPSSLLSAIVVTPADALGKVEKPCALTQKYLASCSALSQTKNVLTLTAFRALGTAYRGETDIVSGKKSPAFIAYTSGTTGDPKAILLSNENIIAEMISLSKSTHMRLGPSGNALQVVPFNYPYGFLISTLLPMFVGKTAALTPIVILSNIYEYLFFYQPVYIQSIPSFYSYILTEARFKTANLSFLKYAVSGGDKLDLVEKQNINAFLERHGSKSKILDGSGNGEGCGCLTTSVLLGRYNPSSIGKANKGLSVKFVDEDGNTVPLGETGRFCFAGKNVMLGYYNDPEETAKVKYRDSDGIEWFHTDTYGHMDKHGWIYFDGRERRFFITYDTSGSPYKVYCDHVQEVIRRSGSVVDVAVVQSADTLRSFVPKAYLRLAEGTDFEASIQQIKAWCEKELPGYAAPVVYEQISVLPLTPAGKIDYRSLEEKAYHAGETPFLNV